MQCLLLRLVSEVLLCACHTMLFKELLVLLISFDRVDLSDLSISEILNECKGRSMKILHIILVLTECSSMSRSTLGICSFCLSEQSCHQK